MLHVSWVYWEAFGGGKAAQRRVLGKQSFVQDLEAWNLRQPAMQRMADLLPAYDCFCYSACCVHV